MTVLELFRNGVKVAEVEISSWTLRELVELLRVEVNLLNREGRLRNDTGNYK